MSDQQQRSSSSGSSTLRPVLAIGFAFMLLIGGCQKLDQNGTFDSWAEQMEHNSR